MYQFRLKATYLRTKVHHPADTQLLDYQNWAVPGLNKTPCHEGKQGRHVEWLLHELKLCLEERFHGFAAVNLIAMAEHKCEMLEQTTAHTQTCKHQQFLERLLFLSLGWKFTCRPPPLLCCLV